MVRTLVQLGFDTRLDKTVFVDIYEIPVYRIAGSYKQSNNGRSSLCKLRRPIAAPIPSIQ